MINDIVVLRNQGLSLEKIANQLNLSIEHVQNQWDQFIENQMEAKQLSSSFVQAIDRKESLSSLTPIIEHMTAWLVLGNRVLTSWNVSKSKKHLVEVYFEQPFDRFKQVLKIYDVTCIIFNGNNAHHVHEICLPNDQHYWIFSGLKSNRCYLFEIGLKISDFKYFPLLQSNAIHMPRDSKVQVSDLDKDIKEFQHQQYQPPNWIEHVSTYSFYSKGNRMEKK